MTSSFPSTSCLSLKSWKGNLRIATDCSLKRERGLCSHNIICFFLKNIRLRKVLDFTRMSSIHIHGRCCRGANRVNMFSPYTHMHTLNHLASACKFSYNPLCSSSSAFIYPLLDVDLSSDLPSLPMLSRADPIHTNNGCFVIDPCLLWPPLASP